MKDRSRKVGPWQGPEPGATAEGGTSLIRVLLVDDHSALREVISAYLTKYPSVFKVVAEAANGKAAVELAQSLKPDVIIMDLRMPVLDGVEATRMLKSMGNPARIIAYTSLADNDAVDRTRSAGAVACLPKPCNLEDLKEAILAAAG